MRPELRKIGRAAFVDGPVDLLGRLIANAFNFCQRLQACGHDSFNRAESVEPSNGSYGTHPRNTCEDVDLAGALTAYKAPRTPDGNLIRRMKLVCREEDQSCCFILILGTQDRNARPDCQSHQRTLNPRPSHTCSLPLMGRSLQNQERATW